jgi:peroxiredoxin
MALSERVGDRLVVVVSLLVVGALVGLGWLVRDRPAVAVPGDPAPPLDLPLIDGGGADLEAYRGQVVLLNIWATWCPPCVHELPSMQRLYETYADRGLVVLAVAVDAEPGEPGPDGRIEGVVSRFAQRLGLTFPIAVDPTGDTERRLGVTQLPTTVLIDRSGRIRVREVGGRFWDREPHVNRIVSLLEEDRG